MEACDDRDLRSFLGSDLVLNGRRLEFLELQFHLVDQAGTALRAVAVSVPPQFGDLELEMLDHRLGRPDDRPDLRQFTFGGLCTSLGSLDTGLGSRNGGSQSGDLQGGI